MSRWTLVQPEDTASIDSLMESLGVSKAIATLLVNRDVTTFDSAKRFFRPTIADLYDPFLLKDMEFAATRMAKAVRDQETVVVYGDYDVDGTTATSIIFTFLKDFGVKAHYYIPHRFKEGYGISEDGIDYALQNKASLIVSVDCGITAVEEAKYAKKEGIDLIICDHHNPGDEIPDALAVLDPKRRDCTYPFDGLSGAGVGFKLVQGTISKLGLNPDLATKFLDLVAISIASDIVPLIDENRILMREGLEILRNSPKVGIRALCELIKLDPAHITTSKIVFSLGPRINAAGRMGDAKAAVELLISEDYDDALLKARALEEVNKKRRTIDSETMDNAIEMLDTEMDPEKMAALVLHHPDWHLGVIGIVASRLVDKYCRPAIMLSSVDGFLKGSARSVKGFNVYDALKECEDLLVQFGGHEFAAGLTLKEEHLEMFRARFDEIVGRRLNSDDYEPEFMIDAELNLNDVDVKFWKILKQFAPHGPNNASPLFVSHNLKVVGTPTVVGNGHLKFKVAHSDSAVFEAIGFNLHEHLPKLRNCEQGCLSMVYALDENTWNNRTTLQIRVKDLKFGQPEIVTSV